MNEPTLPELHNRVIDLEEWKKGCSDAIKSLQISMVKMDTDVSTLKDQLTKADAARDRQTATLLDAINDTKKRALNQVPPWASTAITILTALCAALVTAFYHS